MAGSYDGDFQFVSKVGKNDGGNVEIEKSLTVGGNVIADGDGINQDLIPPASDEIAGKVKIGNGIAVDSNGEISLTPATDQQLGGITPGEGLATDQDGKLDFTGVFGGVLYVLEDDQETGGGIVAQNSVTVAGNLIADGNGLNLELIPLATDEIAGKVKIGNGISVLSDGTIYLTVEPAAASDFTAHLANPDAHGAGSTPSAGKIAQWNEDGNLESGSPTEENEVTTRAFIAEFFRTTTLSIKARTGAVVKIKIGSVTEWRLADEDGFVNLETQHQGDCEISATYKGVPVGKTENFIVYQYNKYEIDLEIPQDFIIYGVRQYVNESSPALTRLGDSAEFTFTPETPTQIGSSDFDDGPIFSEIKTCVVDFVDGEMMITYEDDPEFSRTPATGDVCVEIPKYYYWIDTSHLSDTTPYKDTYISNIKVNNNFIASPAHMDRGDGEGERNKVWIGCYLLDSNMRSISGSTPQVSKSLSWFRESISNRIQKGHIADLTIFQTIRILYEIVAANLNSQAIIGDGLAGIESPANNGSTDDIFYSSGVSENGGIRLFGLENLWGNLAQVVEGLESDGSNYYITVDPEKYGSRSEMAMLSYGVYSATSFRSTDGMDENHPWAQLPTGVQSGGSSSTFFCDRIVVGSAGGRNMTVGGYYSQSKSYTGLYATSLSPAAETGNASSLSARLAIF